MPTIRNRATQQVYTVTEDELAIIQANPLLNTLYEYDGPFTPPPTGGSSGGYKVYTAFLFQTGTGNPSAVVLQNTLGGTPVWNREDVGQYSITLASAFPDNKTFSPNAVLSSDAGGYDATLKTPIYEATTTTLVGYYYLNAWVIGNALLLWVVDADGMPAELSALMGGKPHLPIEIRVYP